MSNEALLGLKVADRFTITRLLGEGGMATVYVAEQDQEPRQVALKILNEDLLADRTFMHRFRREAQAAARVQHPNSVQIIAYGVASGLPYIAMELLAGADLYALLERHGAMAQGRAARILAEVCDVLAVAHELGIVHRDLKPENIMVIADPKGPGGERVKVLDFGIAKLLTPDAAERRSSPDTRAGTFIGTPAYMSPEQCNLQPLDTRADIYTCGVLLFQLITGRLPFEGETPLHTATLHIQEEPPLPSNFAPDIDPRLEAIILRALSKKPAARQPTARHLGEALRRLLPELRDVPVGTGPISKRAVSLGFSEPLAELEELAPSRDSDPTTRYVTPKKASRVDPADIEDLPTLPSAEAEEEPDIDLDETVQNLPVADVLPPQVVRREPGRTSAPALAPAPVSVPVPAPVPARASVPVPVRASAPAPVPARRSPPLVPAEDPTTKQYLRQSLVSAPSIVEDTSNPRFFRAFFSATLFLSLVLVAYYFLAISPGHP